MKAFRLLLFFFLCAFHMNAQDLLEAYQRAELFLPGNVSRIVYNENIIPHFLANSSKFWYLNESEQGKEYYLVDPEKESNKPAFNHKSLAKKLSDELEIEFDPYNLDLHNLFFNLEEQYITFNLYDEKWRYHDGDKYLR